MSIFMVEESYDHDDDYGPSWRIDTEDTPGYFTSREEAQAWVDKTDGPVVASHEARVEKYEADCATWRTKDEELKALGGKNAAPFPYRPTQIYSLHRVVEIQPAEVQV